MVIEVNRCAPNRLRSANNVSKCDQNVFGAVFRGRIHNPKVGGSIPPPATNKINNLQYSLFRAWELQPQRHSVTVALPALPAPNKSIKQKAAIMAQRLKRSFRYSSLSIGIPEYIGNLSYGIDYSLNSTLASRAVWAPAHSTLLNDHVTITSARYRAPTKLIAIPVGRIVRKCCCVVKSSGVPSALFLSALPCKQTSVDCKKRNGNE